MAAPIDTLTTENIVGSTSIEQEVDLNVLSEDLDTGDFEPEKTPGLVYRPEEFDVTSIIFRTGKIVSTGAQTPEHLTKGIERTFEELRDIGLADPNQPEVSVHNIVSTGDLGSRLNLSAIAIGLGLEYVEYEPEQFPGLVYRPPEMDRFA